MHVSLKTSAIHVNFARHLHFFVFLILDTGLVTMLEVIYRKFRFIKQVLGDVYICPYCYYVLINNHVTYFDHIYPSHIPITVSCMA